MQHLNGSPINKNSHPQDDESLIRGALRGDPDALETLFARNNTALYQTALRLLGNPEDAKDELREMLEEDLEELSPLLRSAFLLREIEGLTTEEAAKTLRVSQNTLKARLWRARQQLADKLRRRLRRNDSVATGPQGGRFGLGAMSYACGAD